MQLKIVEKFQENQYEEVCKIYESINPKTLEPNTRYIIAISYFFTEAYDNALKICKNIKTFADELPDFYLYLSWIYLKLGEYKRADYYLKHPSINQQLLIFFELKVELSIKQGRAKGAQYYINKAKSLNIVSTGLQINQAILLMNRHLYSKAEKLLITVIKKEPENVIVYENLVRIYKSVRAYSKIEVLMIKYLEQDPDYLPFLWELALLYSAQANHKKIAPLIKKIDLSDGETAYLREIFLIPSNYDSVEQINDYRKKIQGLLNQALSKKQYPNRPDRTYRCTPFYLSYHNQGNRDILEKIYAMMSKKLLQVPTIKKNRRTKKKIAIISQNFFSQSVMDFYLNTLVGIPKDIEMTIINIEPYKVDHVTKQLMERADHYLQPSSNQEELIPLILKGKYDMIIYPEIGMSSVIYYLAMQRLAPIQTALIGHPDTSGMSTIDYYISWRYFHLNIDQPGTQFTESLIQLNEIPIAYDFPIEIDAIETSRKEVGMPDSPAIIYFVPMLLFKVHPSFDNVIKSILSNDSRAHIMFVQFNRIESIIQERLKQKCSTSELKRISFHTPFLKKDYFSVLQQSNVILETFPFGGGNTMLQSLAVGTPYISLKGEFLRSSFGTGFYGYIGEVRFTANTIDEYVDVAIKTANDPNIKADLKKVIQKNKAKLFNNMAGSYEFYDWMRSVLK